MQAIGNAVGDAHEDDAMRAMFVARKEVFIDLLGWDVPVLDGRFEVDQFDDTNARYLILLDDDGGHCASARLLPTTRPHILDTLYPGLVEGELPCGDNVLEITRFCLDRHQSAVERRQARNRLVSAIADFALANDIKTYTGVAEFGWLQQILSFGWRCRLLGLPSQIGSQTLGALRIDIDDETTARLTSAGIYDVGAAAKPRTFDAKVAA